MIVEAVIRSEPGWDIDTLTKIRNLPATIRVDATHLRPEGRFGYLHVFFPDEETATACLDEISKGTGAPVTRVI